MVVIPLLILWAWFRHKYLPESPSATSQVVAEIANCEGVKNV